MKKNSFKNLLVCVATTTLVGCNVNETNSSSMDSISGIYPRLAYYNNEGECGTGAVVPWGDRLWVITYGPHLPYGSSDKLYEVTPDYQLIVRDESIGGTPANRMIHKESNQLFIGPYAIDANGGVRVIPYKQMPGRHTGNARHLTDPENKICYATMEEGFYSVDVHTLDVDTLYLDGNAIPKPKNQPSYVNNLLPGAHGKGFYSGQGVAVYSNNGENSKEAMTDFDAESGVLAEWNGKDWKVVRRNQFVEVTGPGGIYGNSNPETDPIWVTGWDHKSVLLGVREPQKGWSFYRLPKASHSYDGAHGWNTEWPRIRNVGTQTNPDYLMTMHGMFWRFPENFTSDNSAGIRPRSSYLKVIGDFTRWGDQLVFGCDDSAQKEFLNKRKAKGGIQGPGQSNSNLWFTSLEKPDELGPTTAEGAVWDNEKVKAGEYSEPFLFGAWLRRCAWLKNHGSIPVTYTFEVDVKGNNQWAMLRSVQVNPNEAKMLEFESDVLGEWIRVKVDKETNSTVHFSYTNADNRSTTSNSIFNGLAENNSSQTTGGLLYGLGDNRRVLGVVSYPLASTNENESYGYYEMSDDFKLVKKEDSLTMNYICDKFGISNANMIIDEGSVLIVDDKNRRWRLPLGDDKYKTLTNNGQLRICREVATERDLFSCMGTFYELPAENADGYAKMRPITTHNYLINDYASYRGMLVMTGVDVSNVSDNKHIVVSDDGKASVWVGAIDDLWNMGKPVGYGGPWKNTKVKAGVPSDPYLIAYYDSKVLSISHQDDSEVTIHVEVDPTGCGNWMKYDSFTVKSKETFTHQFSEMFQARWIRFVSDKDAQVTAWLEYK